MLHLIPVLTGKKVQELLKIQHPSIVVLHGICFDIRGQRLIAVTEQCPNGTLAHRLREFGPQVLKSILGTWLHHCLRSVQSFTSTYASRTLYKKGYKRRGSKDTSENLPRRHSDVEEGGGVFERSHPSLSMVYRVCIGLPSKLLSKLLPKALFYEHICQHETELKLLFMKRAFLLREPFSLVVNRVMCN